MRQKFKYTRCFATVRSVVLVLTASFLVAFGWAANDHTNPPLLPENFRATPQSMMIPQRIFVYKSVIKKVPVPGPVRTVYVKVSRGAETRYSQGHAGLIAFGKYLQGLGFDVSENPAFGGVCYTCHSVGSLHYSGRAIDINWNGSGEKAKIDAIVGLADRYGLHTLWQVRGHYDHLHADTGR